MVSLPTPTYAASTGYSKAVEDAQFTGYLFISRTTVRATLKLC